MRRLALLPLCTLLVGRLPAQRLPADSVFDRLAGHWVEAVVLFGHDPATGECAMLWMDNTATTTFEQHGVGRGHVSGDSIPFVFDYSALTKFHTTLAYDRRADAWHWSMENDSLGVRRPFARLTMTRQ